ncbi:MULTISPECIES: diguanylate cyclase domain-containing protein [Cycloclasticus]|uniref:diguanylate cyclase n=1 Tax=Cycloclasticus pugetii TaxID=34068 RepID=A0AB33Z5N3_9GAMM|nr:MULTISPECIES: diguanylate cyclase [Cycloclasticus]ATI03843.1 diguanylate cyclase [Cycloclasticus sp. PY97N]EPD14276.1 PAS/PAC sensor-containing diguanylate cyclase [Cycloclasticus pugetii]
MLNKDQLLEPLMSQLVTPAFVLDANGKVLIWNKACERLTNVKADQVLGTNRHWQAFYDHKRDCLADLLVNGNVDKLKALYSYHSDNNHFGVHAQNWCQIPNVPGHFYLAVDAGAIYNEKGKLIAVVETIRDITEQKLAQENLNRLMQDHVTPTFALDADGEVLIWNRACEQLTNCKAENMIGTKNHWQAFYDEKRDCLADLLLKNNTDKIAELYSLQIDDAVNEHRLRVENWCQIPKVPGHFYLAIDAAPIYNEAGDLVAVVESLRNMTEAKLAQEKLERLAQYDGLTGLANRRSFDQRLQGDWNLAERNQTPISLLFIDIDCFKQFNDIYGHQTGDDCLKAVASVISGQCFRPSDLSARYGGEEFTIILPNTDKNGAQVIAERVRKAVFDLHWEHSGNTAADYVTISIGIGTCIPSTGQTVDTLIKMADESLYKAKEQGRNRIY